MLKFSIFGDIKYEGTFSASADYKRVSKTTETDAFMYIITELKCMEFTISVDKHLALPISKNFKEAVTDLINENEDKYLEFFSEFGTHFFLTQRLGAKFYIESSFSRHNYEQLTSNDFNLNVAANGSLAKFLNISISTEYSNKYVSNFETKRNKSDQYSVGAYPPRDGDLDSWARSSAETPSPIEYELKPITELLTQKNFPSINPADLEKIKVKLNDLYFGYCESIGGISCKDGPKPDIKLFTSFVQNNSAAGQSIISCPKALLGIGFRRNYGDVPNQGKSNQLYYYKQDSHQGICYDSRGAHCYGVCTDAFRKEEIYVEESNRTDGETDVSCPLGYYVSGCGLDLTSFYNKPNLEKFPASYVLNITTCRCYSSWSYKCQAFCVPKKGNLEENYNYKLISNYGTKHFEVSCSEEEIAIGCGYLSKQETEPEEYWDVYPEKNKCKCYNNYGATCYAVCLNLYKYRRNDLYETNVISPSPNDDTIIRIVVPIVSVVLAVVFVICCVCCRRCKKPKSEVNETDRSYLKNIYEI